MHFQTVSPAELQFSQRKNNLSVITAASICVEFCKQGFLFFFVRVSSEELPKMLWNRRREQDYHLFLFLCWR